MRSVQLWILAAAVLALAPLPLAAQTTAITVVEAGTGRPVTSSLVVLLDSAGRQVAGAVTGPEGRVTLRAPAPGTYRLRTERVGFATTLSAPFTLADAEVLSQRVEVAAAAIVLDGLVARGSRRCVLRPEEGTATNRIWEEARKALNASAWTDALGLVEYRSNSYRRDLDRETHRVLREEVRPRSGRGVRPYASRPAAELAERGYVRPDGDGWMHYGPDAEVLLSDEFLDTHCFRVQAGAGENRGRIGLSFEPMRGRRLPDVKGVLWLDAKSAELKTLDFDYTNLPQGYGDGRRAGGRVEFERLPNGIWIVRRWWIRVDRMEEQVSQWRGQVMRNPKVVAIEEIGGEVMEVQVAGVEVGGGIRAALEGVVAHPDREQVPAGTEVFLLGTPYRAPVDSLGRFRLADLPAGLYTVALAHPQLTALSVAGETQEVTLRSAAPVRVEFDFPSPAAAVEAACPAPRRSSGERTRTGLVFGAVRESGSGAPVAKLRVAVTWATFEARGGRLTRVDHHVYATTDAEGRFLVCDVPLAQSAELRVAERGISAEAVPVHLEASPLVEQNLVIRRTNAR